jgi:prevent-host-death family protein
LVDTIGGERVASLTELRRRAKAIIEEVQAATNQQETRVVLTVHGKPVVVLQEYGAYQKMLELLAETQRQLHVAEMGNRLRQRNEPKPTTKRSLN